MRLAALSGARKIGAYAPPRDCRAASRTLFFRVERECGLWVPPMAALLYDYMAMYLDICNLLFSRMAGPDLVPMAEKRTGG